MANPQLKLVSEKPPQPQPTDPVRQIFDHWVLMLGRSPSRTKLGPTRNAVILQALQLYDCDMLMAAIDGMAADPLKDCTQDRIRDAMREIEWLLAREARIERWAEAGDRLRMMAEREAELMDAPRVQAAAAEPDDPAMAARALAAKQRLLRLRVEMACKARGG